LKEIGINLPVEGDAFLEHFEEKVGLGSVHSSEGRAMLKIY